MNADDNYATYRRRGGEGTWRQMTGGWDEAISEMQTMNEWGERDGRESGGRRR